jgi:two-component system chemotaxis response regulator CheB
MSETRNQDLREYRCLVGHKYSARSLLEAHSDAQERALWAAVVALEESTNLVQMLRPGLPGHLAMRLEGQAERKRRQAVEIRGVLERLEAFQVE